MFKLTLALEGLTCEHCVRAVRQALEQLEGVESVQVDLNSATLTGSFDQQAALAAIQEEGYGARPA